MRRVETKDETWVHYFDPEAKKQSMQWKHLGSPNPKKFKRVSSAGKVMASIFWYSQCVIMVDYFEEGRTMNGAYYAEELRRLCQEIVKKRRGPCQHYFSHVEPSHRETKKEKRRMI